MKWIGVKDELPPEGEEVLCINDNGVYCIDYWEDSESSKSLFQGSAIFKNSHTHWMELPENPNYY